MTERWLVVGAGSAGCVVAARLAECGRNVTLVEAGPDLAPGRVPPAIAGPDFLAALAEPGRVHDDLRARRHPGADPEPYLRGRGVGGSSAVNALIGLRGDARQYASWGWSDVGPAWSRVRVPVEAAADDELGAVDRALLAAAPDARPAPLTRTGRRRVTTAEAYLWPVPTNLTIRSGSTVDRVLFDGRRAAGVVLADGVELAADEVVLAAGAIHTPAILLRSGADTPGIGTGLQDHPSAAITLVLRAGAAPDAGDPGGRLAIGAVLDRGALQVLPMNRVGIEPADAGLGLLAVALMRPHGAAGRVTLGSADPLAPPEVEFDLLGHPGDLAGLRAGVGVLLDLLQHDAFASIVERAVVDEQGTGVGALADDRSIERWLWSASGGYVHAASSCRMGVVVDDDGALVGYEGIRVCDASVFPRIPAANPHLPTVMLAERLTARWGVG